MRYTITNQHRSRSRCGGAVGVELLAGLVVALACGALWVFVAHKSGQELIYTTLAIGVVIGVTVSSTAKMRSTDTGITAAGLTAITVLLAKLCIIQLSINATLNNPVPPPTRTTTSSQQVESGENSSATQAPVETDAVTPDPNQPLDTNITTDLSAAPRSFWIKTALSNTDLLWIALAMALAFVIGKGYTAKTATAPGDDTDGEAAADSATDHENE